jgi:predicted ATPase
MTTDRITRLTIEGMRSVARLELPLGGLTVLIGENGSGKSTILEACELLRRAADQSFLGKVNNLHGGSTRLLRHGAQDLKLGVRLEGNGAPLDYEITLTNNGHMLQIAGERLTQDSSRTVTFPLPLIEREGTSAAVFSPGGSQKVPAPHDQLVLSSAGLFAPHPGFARMREALANIDMHLPFDVMPVWAAEAHGYAIGARGRSTLQHVDRLERFGTNLANVFHTLRAEYNEDHWRTTMDYVRLGLGDHIEAVTASAQGGHGSVALALMIRNRDQRIPISALSDGMVAYLCFVALTRLGKGRTLLAFDEPELHLHPGLLVRVLGFFEAAAEDCPVLLATHSDRLLDALRDPVRSVRVCEADASDEATRLRSLDAAALADWLTDYRGLGDLRTAGYMDMVLKAPSEDGEPPAVAEAVP